ncbi:uncharacterized protein LOC114668104 [Erpetoichthys calabaricus]|uniref:uncharacterized protein LOC114668104 n=1 Tax=Erpetoichthys calabaricus TaxID=27687 RepID=UPI00109EFDAC|nr:uncharacterized protein LOC114668104 [Erpetoichthys calabaricus]
MYSIICITSLLFLTGAEALSVIQPPFVTAVTGKDTVLPCVFNPGDATVKRRIPHWYFGERINRTDVYPENNYSSSHHKGRVTMEEEDGNNSISLRMLDVHPGDHNTYYCMMSCIANDFPQRPTGNGTLLFVHGHLNLSAPMYSLYDQTIILSCNVTVAKSQHAQLFWMQGTTELSEEISVQSITRLENGMEALQSQLTTDFPNMPVTYTCVLTYNSQHRIINESVTLNPAEAPVLLYTAVILKSLLILLIVLCAIVKERRSSSL